MPGLITQPKNKPSSQAEQNDNEEDQFPDHIALFPCAFQHGDDDAVLLRGGNGFGVTGIRMADNTHTGVGGEHALQAVCGFGRAVGNDHLPGVLAVANAHSAAVMEADPGGAVDRVDQALRIGQSLTASVPSSMPSVSRLGDATEPESRWSRPMTMGALTMPLATSSLNLRPALARSP